jgi:Ankyrin repeats (many copies)
MSQTSGYQQRAAATMSNPQSFDPEDIKTYIQREDPTGLADLLQNISYLSPKTWLSSIEGMLKKTSSKDLRTRLLDSLLSYGTTTERRLLLNLVCRDIANPDDDATPRKGLSSAEATQLIASRLFIRDPALITSVQNSRTLFHAAAIDGAESLVVLAIEHAPPGVDLAATINRPDNNQKTALTWAVDHNRVAVMRILLSKVSSLNVEPALVRSAITSKLFELACVMIELRPNAVDRDTIGLAVDEGRPEPLALMLKSRSDLLKGSQLLHRAVAKRHPEIVELLLNTRPELATELVEGKHPALAYNIAMKKEEPSAKKGNPPVKREEDPSVSIKIRNLIVPRIIRRQSPSAIRLLVADAWGELGASLSSFTKARIPD